MPTLHRGTLVHDARGVGAARKAHRHRQKMRKPLPVCETGKRHGKKYTLKLYTRKDDLSMEEKIYRCFPKTVRVEATEQNARAFIRENVDNFLDWMFLSNEYTVSEYLDDNMENFSEFLLSGGGNE